MDCAKPFGIRAIPSIDAAQRCHFSRHHLVDATTDQGQHHGLGAGSQTHLCVCACVHERERAHVRARHACWPELAPTRCFPPPIRYRRNGRHASMQTLWMFLFASVSIIIIIIIIIIIHPVAGQALVSLFCQMIPLYVCHLNTLAGWFCSKMSSCGVRRTIKCLRERPTTPRMC